MIHELAVIEVRPGSEAAFEAAVSRARPLFLAAEGCRSVELHRTIEVPQRYILQVGWDTVEHHTVGFRGSPAFAQWRELAGPHFAGPPEVTHVTAIALS